MRPLTGLLCAFYFGALINEAAAQAADKLVGKLEPKAVVINKWAPAATTDSVFLWPFSFGEDSSKSELLLKMLRNQYITNIQLVYTHYAADKRFDQKTLNRLRMEKLEALHPEWFTESSNINWEFIEQTGCYTAGRCNGFFHGFAFYYVSKAKMATEYRSHLWLPRNDVSRPEEIESFYYWFEENINKDGRFVPRNKDTTQVAKAKAVFKPETKAEVAQRVQEMKELANSGEPSNNEQKQNPGKTSEKKAERSKTRDESASKKQEGKKELTDAKKDTISAGKTETVSLEPRTVKVEAPAKKRVEVGSPSRVLALYFASVYPEKSKNGATKTWSQYVLQLLKKRLEAQKLFFYSYGWKMNCGGKDTPRCIDCPPWDTITYKPSCAECYDFPNRPSKPYEYDGTVPEVLERLKSSFVKMDIAADITLGMIPPVSELLHWANTGQNVTRVYKAVFYNDGDTIDNIRKKIGSTGGIYPTVVFDFIEADKNTLFIAQDRLFAAACHAARGGSGGDVTENAVEAGTKAQSLCPDCDVHILIADNRSPIRDMILLKDLKYPVRVILPFVIKERGLINTEYLDIARQTHGSVHTKTNDYYDLDKMKNGETLQVLEYKYMFNKDHFVCVQVPQ
ncbi:MAG: hypothetical protein JWO06_2889 [Bacteroidota bacterium]|nr:hypothetical protein [Bacteroidota bacterium]